MLSSLSTNLPAGPQAQQRLGLLVRSRTDFTALARSIHAITRELDPDIAVRVSRLEENLDFWRTVSRLTAGLSGSLSLLALALASVGVYGVVAYVVSRRFAKWASESCWVRAPAKCSA